MAKRRKKSRSKSRHRSRRRNPGRKHGRRRSRGHRRNPVAAMAASFSPLKTVKGVAGQVAPLAVGYFGVNLVQLLVKRLFLDKALASQSPGVQAAGDLAARVLIGVPAVVLVGGKFLRGKGGLVAAGAGANIVVNLGRVIVANVPGVPSWASDALGDWPGTPGVYGFMTPQAHPRLGVQDFNVPNGRDSARLPSMASGGRGMF